MPRYFTAIKALLGTYCALCFFQGIYTLWCYFDNKSRESKGFHAERPQEELLEGYDDLTDKQNLHFRYKL